MEFGMKPLGREKLTLWLMLIPTLIGLVFGVLLVSRMPYVSFSLPTGQLILCGIAAVIIGIVAAIFPARRAARLNVLEALQYE